MRSFAVLVAVLLLAGCNFRPDIKGQDYSLVDDRIPVGASGHVKHLGPSSRIDALLTEQSWSGQYADQRPGIRLIADKVNLTIGDHFLIGFIHPGSDQMCRPAKQEWDELERFLRNPR